MTLTHSPSTDKRNVYISLEFFLKLKSDIGETVYNVYRPIVYNPHVSVY